MLLYDDWDRDAYPTPFGPIPHDLAVRLYYLNRPACWHFAIGPMAGLRLGDCSQDNLHAAGEALMVIGRNRDLPALNELGQVEVLSRNSPVRWDRAYLLARVDPYAMTATRMATPSSLVSTIHR